MYIKFINSTSSSTVNIEFAAAAQIRDAGWIRTRDHETSEEWRNRQNA